MALILPISQAFPVIDGCSKLKRVSQRRRGYRSGTRTEPSHVSALEHGTSKGPAVRARTMQQATGPLQALRKARTCNKTTDPPFDPCSGHCQSCQICRMLSPSSVNQIPGRTSLQPLSRICQIWFPVDSKSTESTEQATDLL